MMLFRWQYGAAEFLRKDSESWAQRKGPEKVWGVGGAVEDKARIGREYVFGGG